MTEILKQENTIEHLPPHRTYKDRIFRMLFKEKSELLKLYNAMNNTTYENSDDFVVTTLDNAIYMGMKNDISFLLYDILTLYEHQSTHNPNIPLRNLFYVADLYSVLTKDKNLYGTKMIRIPEPKFIVFYNGIDEKQEQFTLKLSDMFSTSSEHTSLELETQVFNINWGYNKELMSKCKSLHDYSVFVNLMRNYHRSLPLENAIEKAINECIANDILADFLRQNRAEVLKMGIYEYNEAQHIKLEREDAEEDGIQKGIYAEQIRLVKVKLSKGKTLEAIADDLELSIDKIREIYLSIQNDNS